jgi:pyruvate dehydrogenase E2 component (dihydrolipoamide acetyltransferase)
MAVQFTMPKLGLDMTSGVIVHWLVGEGAQVIEGQPIVEIETDKATQELTAPVDGKLARILRQEKAEVPCGETIAIILAPGEELPELESEAFPPSAVALPVDTKNQPTTASMASPAERVFISPIAKRRAQELGIDLTKVVPRNGKVGLEEVEEAARLTEKEQADTKVQPAEREELSSTRRSIAEHMSRSAHTVARVGLTLEADAAGLVAWRAALTQSGRNISYNVLLASLAARALREFPYMNAQLDGESIVVFPEINIGIAVDTPKGLVVPVLHQVDRKSIPELQAEYEALAERALNGKSRLEDLQGGTFTITNLGSLEIETFLPVINVPQAAILGVGAILKKPVALEDQVVIRPRLNFTLAFDHRLIDGAPAARFLQRIKQLVEAAGDPQS